MLRSWGRDLPSSGTVTAAARPVIIPHGIRTPQRSAEPGEEVFWLSQTQFCDVLDRIEEMGPAAPQITFDDGNASDMAIALPELERRHPKAPFFLLSGRLGQPGSLTKTGVAPLPWRAIRLVFMAVTMWIGAALMRRPAGASS